MPDDEELRRKILRSRHDAPALGHQGRAKTLELVSRTFYWPILCQYIHCYVNGYDICQRSKSIHYAQYRLMQPISLAHAPWKRIFVDFIVKLSISCGYDSVMVVVDKNTKLSHFIPTKETIDSQDTALLYLHHIWKHHGTPNEVISNCGQVFVSKFMTRLLELLCIKPSPSTAFHLQRDDQTESINQVLKQYLRMFTSRCQDN